jgi:type VI secretion system protein ImpA
MFASGEAQPREGEEARDLATLDRTMMEADLAAVVERRGQIEAVQTAISKIKQICTEKIGQTANVEKVPALADKIFNLLNGVVAKRDPAAAVVAPAAEDAATAQASPSGPVIVGRIASKADAACALAAIARYFNQAEPSNPALLLVRQAEQLMGKSLLEVMQILMPGQVEQAKFWIGKDNAFDIPMERLAPFATIDPPADAQEFAAGDGSEGDAAPTPATAEPPALNVQSRQEAFALLEQVTGYFRAAEPSSPIAMITERARLLGERDFLTLLKDLLPPAS